MEEGRFHPGSEVYERALLTREIVEGVLAMTDPKTGVAPSHLGHPGYEDLAFTYDKAVDALVFKAAGERGALKALADYFAERLRIPEAEVKRYADANGIYGMLKLYPLKSSKQTIGLANAFSALALDRAGQAKLEYFITPGPVAFMILAFLQADRQEYVREASMLGEVLLAMQLPDGGLSDGDRGPENIHTEPHMDSYSAFLMLYDVTGEARWKNAAERAWAWFTANVYRPEQGIIYQGMRPNGPSQVFATDGYSWTIAGRGGERIPLDALEKLTDTMLARSISRVTLELPNGTKQTLTLVDFSDIKDMRVIVDRNGFHPMGSIEWVGGVILALQKNAVRFWEEGSPVNREKARTYKALAEYFMAESLRAFYHLEGRRGLLSFYATGQWVATGHGWRTPYFYVKDKTGKPVIKGGSTIGAWPLLPLNRFNPFKLDDHYGTTYDAIPLTPEDKDRAEKHATALVDKRVFTESIPDGVAAGADEVPEMWRYNREMFRAFSTGDYYSALLWAQKSVSNKEWRDLARQQQEMKEREIGGLVAHPWGVTSPAAEEAQRVIRRYPLLNEMGAAMWGMAVCQFRLGNKVEAKQWIRSVIEAIAYHQIFAPDGPGYWNALVSWETNPAGSALDAEMGILYREVLSEMGRTTALPQNITLAK